MRPRYDALIEQPIEQINRIRQNDKYRSNNARRVHSQIKRLAQMREYMNEHEAVYCEEHEIDVSFGRQIRVGDEHDKLDQDRNCELAACDVQHILQPGAHSSRNRV